MDLPCPVPVCLYPPLTLKAEDDRQLEQQQQQEASRRLLLLLEREEEVATLRRRLRAQEEESAQARLQEEGSRLAVEREVATLRQRLDAREEESVQAHRRLALAEEERARALGEDELEVEVRVKIFHPARQLRCSCARRWFWFHPMYICYSNSNIYTPRTTTYVGEGVFFLLSVRWLSFFERRKNQKIEHREGNLSLPPHHFETGLC